jgi:cobalt-zinc-cadmium efflux system membrane fusion protein
MFVTGRVLVESTEVPVAVPPTALHTINEETVVFVQTDEGFKPQPVELGRAGETHVEILSGLSPGEPYVSRGGFTLKAELGKEAFGDGHAH